MKKTEVIKIDRQVDRNSDFHAARWAPSMLPLPRWNATRMDAASDKPSVAASNRSQTASRIPHAATIGFLK